MTKHEIGMFKKYENCTFEQYKTYTAYQKEVVRKLRLFSEQWEQYQNKDLIITLSGYPGTGKTHLAYSILNNIIAHEEKRNVKSSLKFMKSFDLFCEIKSSYNRIKQTELSEIDIINKYRKHDLLIIDDITEDDDSEWKLSRLLAIIDGRVDNEKPTMIITNFDKKEMEKYFKKFHNRLGSRVFAAHNWFLGFNWEDYRTYKGE